MKRYLNSPIILLFEHGFSSVDHSFKQLCGKLPVQECGTVLQRSYCSMSIAFVSVFGNAVQVSSSESHGNFVGNAWLCKSLVCHGVHQKKKNKTA